VLSNYRSDTEALAAEAGNVTKPTPSIGAPGIVHEIREQGN
jgi:hypothetical protein